MDSEDYWSAVTDRDGFQALCALWLVLISFVALKAISDFWVKCWGRRGHILGFMIDSLARLNISEVGKYKTL